MPEKNIREKEKKRNLSARLRRKYLALGGAMASWRPCPYRMVIGWSDLGDSIARLSMVIKTPLGGGEISHATQCQAVEHFVRGSTVLLVSSNETDQAEAAQTLLALALVWAKTKRAPQADAVGAVL